METLKIIRALLRKHPFGLIAFAGSAVFALINFWLLNQVTTLASFFQMAIDGDFFLNLKLADAKVAGIVYLIFYWLTTTFIVIGFGASLSLFVWIYKHKRDSCRLNGAAGGGGILGSLFAAGCPVCGAYLLGALGISSGLAIFPLKGLELKFLGAGLLAASIFWETKVVRKLKDDMAEEAELSDSVGLDFSRQSKIIFNKLHRAALWGLVTVLTVNQFLIGSFIPKAQSSSLGQFFGSLFGVQGAAAKEILATKLNPDGKTTTVAKWPTITEVPAEPKGMNALEAAQVVMIARGAPFYAPPGISFDDAKGALEAWQKYEKEIQLPADLDARWKKITSTMTCDYCCGGPTRVTTINRCGCRHAQAYRSVAKYLLANYGDKYSDDEILGELQRWKGVWYPRGVVEDYLLATGRGDVLGHATHGGAGADGRHGL